MKKLLLSLTLLLLSTSSLFAQQVAPVGVVGGAPVFFPFNGGSLGMLSTAPAAGSFGKGSAIQAEANFEMNHFDETKPKIAVLGTFNYGQFVTYIMGERFTLPAETGTLSEVAVHFGQIQGPQIVVAVYPAVDGTAGDNPVKLIGTTAIAQALINIDGGAATDATATVKFDNLTVPQDFFVVAFSPVNSSNQLVTAFSLIGDAAPNRTPDLESRAMMVVVTSNGLQQMLVDGTFNYADPVNIDQATTHFDITARGTTEVPDAAVKVQGANRLSAYPNPANVLVNLSFDAPASKIDILDITGRTVSTVTPSVGSMKETLDVRDLGAGMYTAVVTTQNGIRTSRFSVVR